MKTDLVTKVLLGFIAVLLFLNLIYHFSADPATAAKGNGEIGRYQISAWAAQAGQSTHHSGYFVVDTTTGKVVESREEVHAPGK